MLRASGRSEPVFAFGSRFLVSVYGSSGTDYRERQRQELKTINNRKQTEHQELKPKLETKTTTTTDKRAPFHASP
jgi:hypothetical protein